MSRLLLAGATGLVGREVLRLALDNERIDQVVAPTRRPLPAHARLLNPQVDFDALPETAPWWAVDAVICALGSTIGQAGSQAAFHRIDHDYPLAIARLALARGATAYALVSATGAKPDSRVFYSRTKGELERELATLGFASLVLLRPGLLGGERERRRPMEALSMKLLNALDPLLPRRYRVVPATRVAACLLRSALDAPPGLSVIESENIQGAV